MSRRASTAAVVAALLAAACGGRVRTGDPNPSGTKEGSLDASSSAPTSDDPSVTVALPDCPHGFKAGEAIGRLCVFTTNGLCYETKLEACACTCKKQSGTVCSSGFPEMDGTTKVTCN
jgi:hypothetical protein